MAQDKEFSEESKRLDTASFDNAKKQPIYAGLSERTKSNVLMTAALIAFINLAIAWYFAFITENSLSLTPSDMKPFNEWIDKAGGKQLSADAHYDLNARAMTLVTSLKLVANKQALVLTSFGGAFALLAIGFALFLIGADGAFKVMATSPDKTRVAITGTAPGLLCFLIAGWLIVSGIKHKSELHAPELRSNATLILDTLGASKQEANCEKRDVLTGACKK